MAYVIQILPQILDGLGITFGTFAVTLVFSLPLGALISLGRVSRNQVVRSVFGVYTWVLRGTPLLLQMFFIFFGLPAIGVQLFGRMRLPYVYLAFVLNYAAYFAEIFRSGIQSVEKGQREAARLLGFSSWQMNVKIIWPQVLKKTLPSLGNEVISLVKDTSLVYALGLSEIFKIARSISTRDVTIAPSLVVGVIYLVITAVITQLLKMAEKKVYYEE